MKRSKAQLNLLRRETDARAIKCADLYLNALLAADRVAAEAAVEQALKAGVDAATVHTLVIAPAMRTVGAMWERNELTVADEHLATAISHQALIHLLGDLSVGTPRSLERVLLAAVEGQHHVLGLRMIADVLEGAGYDVMFLGANVPVDALKRFAASHNPAVVGLAFGVAVNESCLAESVFAINEAAPDARIMLGGRAAPPNVNVTGIPWVNDSVEVLATVRRLLDQPAQEIPPFFNALRRPSSGDSGGPQLEPDRQLESATENLARIAAEASDVSRKHLRRAEVFRDLSERDAVTNLPNRRAFDMRIREHTRNGKGGGALLMIDIDKFKAINDSLGHDEGDRMLKIVADAIVAAIRPNDCGARIGGDEFAVLLPKATLADASAIGDRIRESVSGAGESSLTVSVGVTPVSGDANKTLIAVDQAMYVAKAAGRNAVVTTSALDQPPPKNPEETAVKPAKYVSMSRLKVSANRADELIAAFQNRAGLVDDADGFLDLEVLQSDHDSGEIIMISHWRDRDAFKAYMKSSAHQQSHGRIDPLLKDEIKLTALEHLHTYNVAAA